MTRQTLGQGTGADGAVYRLLRRALEVPYDPSLRKW